jgi:hypothetical protein
MGGVTTPCHSKEDAVVMDGVVLHPDTLHERLSWGGHREGRTVARRDRPP